MNKIFLQSIRTEEVNIFFIPILFPTILDEHPWNIKKTYSSSAVFAFSHQRINIREQHQSDSHRTRIISSTIDYKVKIYDVWCFHWIAKCSHIIQFSLSAITHRQKASNSLCLLMRSRLKWPTPYSCGNDQIKWSFLYTSTSSCLNKHRHIKQSPRFSIAAVIISNQREKNHCMKKNISKST